MATDFKLPELGENVESGTVTDILVSVGDTIEKDQPVIELETDKAVVEVPSGEGGVVSEIRAKEGAELHVGDVILVLDGEGAEKKETESKAEKDETPEEEPADEAEESAGEAEAEPSAEEPASEKEEAAATAAAATQAAPEPKEEKQEKPASQPAKSDNGGPVRAAPSVRRLAREIGVDIHDVQPSSSGLITAADVKAAARTKESPDKPAGTPLPAPTGGSKLPDFEKYGAVTREPMSKIRATTAKNMANSWATVPHVTQHDKADITEVEAFRKEVGKLAERAGGKLTVTAMLVRLLAEGLKRFPQFNASLDPERGEIVYKQYYNIGVAVDTDYGLLVPSIKDADTKSFIDIAVELADLSARARERKTTLEELAGSCMTITNLGGIGGTAFTPIVNPPEVAILGVSRASVEPVYMDGEFVPRTMMPISLSYDHRVIDGATAARFARWMCQALEQPLSMFLEG